MSRAPGSTIHFGTGEPVTVLLVRHGVTPMTTAGGYSGSATPGPHLTDEGRDQVARAANLVARVGHDLWPDVAPAARVIASPMVRTQDTGEILAARLGVGTTSDARLAECDFGRWEGLTSDEVEERWPGVLREWHETGTVPAAGGGESMADVGLRVDGLLRGLARDCAGQTVVLATHTVTIRAAVGRSIGLDPGRWYTLRVPPASLTALRIWDDGHAELTGLGLVDELG